MKVLIAGVTGFVGHHLSEFLSGLEPRPQIIGTYYRQNLVHIHSLPRGMDLKPCDLTLPAEVSRLLQEIKPDIIFNLAGIAHVMQAETERTKAFEINAFGVCHLMDAILKYTPVARLVLISTSEVYGKVRPEETPLTEASPMRPHNFYGVTKAAMEMIAKARVEAEKLDVVTLRPFNHIGPKQSDRFVVSNFARQMAKIKLARQEPVLRVGDLSPKRDFTDVRDVARAYWMAALQGKSGEVYNIASEKACSIQEVTMRLMDIVGSKIQIEQDKTRLRKSDLPILLGDASKFRQITGWHPIYEIQTTLQDTFQYWLDVEQGLCLDTHAVSK